MLLQGIQSNSISGNYVWALFGQFTFIALERVVYLNRWFHAKLLIHIFMTILLFIVIFVSVGGELHRRTGVSPSPPHPCSAPHPLQLNAHSHPKRRVLPCRRQRASCCGC